MVQLLCLCRESVEGAAKTCMCPGCRENTEGEYSGLEHEVIPGVVESLKVSLTLRRLLACTLRRACLAVALSCAYQCCVVFAPAPASHPDVSQPRCDACICSPTALHYSGLSCTSLCRLPATISWSGRPTHSPVVHRTSFFACLCRSSRERPARAWQSMPSNMLRTTAARRCQPCTRPTS